LSAGGKSAIGDKAMAMRVEVGAIGAESLKRKDASGSYIFSVEKGLKAFQYRGISRLGQQAEQGALPLEQAAQDPRDGKGPVPVRNGSEDLAGKFLCKQDGAFRLAAGAEIPRAARICQEMLFPAFGAANARETSLEPPTRKELLDNHVYSEIAEILNERGFRPGPSARPGREADRFTVKRVAYLMHTYGLRSRYNRLRDRGMLNRKETADRLGIHEDTVDQWAKHGIIKSHLYNDHGWQLYEIPEPNLPSKHCSRWNRLVDRATIIQKSADGSQGTVIESEEV